MKPTIALKGKLKKGTLTRSHNDYSFPENTINNSENLKIRSTLIQMIHKSQAPVV